MCDNTENDAGREFENDRMRNAWYWAGQLTEFMDQQIAGHIGEWYVEVIAGTPTVVFSDDFSDLGGIPTELRDHHFPDWDKRELSDETRLFFEPSSDRLKVDLNPDWRHFENGRYGWKRTYNGEQVPP